ncbi:MAG: hypothetical protein E2O37_01735 [Proteobacteria bacterium]|nr:MAG: hypothetical protein E2O37_01735 [Pseudomonadota bacterium]
MANSRALVARLLFSIKHDPRQVGDHHRNEGLAPDTGLILRIDKACGAQTRDDRRNAHMNIGKAVPRNRAKGIVALLSGKNACFQAFSPTDMRHRDT